MPPKTTLSTNSSKQPSRVTRSSKQASKNVNQKPDEKSIYDIPQDEDSDEQQSATPARGNKAPKPSATRIAVKPKVGSKARDGESGKETTEDSRRPEDADVQSLEGPRSQPVAKRLTRSSKGGMDDIPGANSTDQQDTEKPSASAKHSKSSPRHLRGRSKRVTRVSSDSEVEADVLQQSDSDSGSQPQFAPVRTKAVTGGLITFGNGPAIEVFKIGPVSVTHEIMENDGEAQLPELDYNKICFGSDIRASVSARNAMQLSMKKIGQYLETVWSRGFVKEDTTLNQSLDLQNIHQAAHDLALQFSDGDDDETPDTNQISSEEPEDALRGHLEIVSEKIESFGRSEGQKPVRTIQDDLYTSTLPLLTVILFESMQGLTPLILDSESKFAKSLAALGSIIRLLRAICQLCRKMVGWRSGRRIRYPAEDLEKAVIPKLELIQRALDAELDRRDRMAARREDLARYQAVASTALKDDTKAQGKAKLKHQQGHDVVGSKMSARLDDSLDHRAESDGGSETQILQIGNERQASKDGSGEPEGRENAGSGPDISDEGKREDEAERKIREKVWPRMIDILMGIESDASTAFKCRQIEQDTFVRSYGLIESSQIEAQMGKLALACKTVAESNGQQLWEWAEAILPWASDQ